MGLGDYYVDTYEYVLIFKENFYCRSKAKNLSVFIAVCTKKENNIKYRHLELEYTNGFMVG